jgi:ribosomal protein S3
MAVLFINRRGIYHMGDQNDGWAIAFGIAAALMLIGMVTIGVLVHKDSTLQHSYNSLASQQQQASSGTSNSGQLQQCIATAESNFIPGETDGAEAEENAISACEAEY